MNKETWLKKLDEEGFTELQVCSLEAGTEPDEHTHDQRTVHVILDGELTITDQEGEKTYRPGNRVEFPAGTTHKALFGPNGLTMIVGMKTKEK